MNLRPFAAAGLALALSGCNNEDLSKPPVVDPKFPIVQKKAEPADKKTEPGAAISGGAAVSYDEAMQKGYGALKTNDLVTAILQFEEAVKLEPQRRDPHLYLAQATQSRGFQMPEGKAKYDMLLRSAEAMRKVNELSRALDPMEQALFAQALYNEACAYALQKKEDKAMASLAEAVDAGFNDAKTLANDTDLVSLRGRPEFAKLVDKAKLAVDKATAQRKAVEASQAEAIVVKVKDDMKSFKSFPFSFALPDLEGKTVKLADTKGKVVIVDLWGTWCPPCKMEIPHFVDLYKKYNSKGLEIIGINYERVPKGKEKETIAAFVKENEVPYKCVLGDEKTQEMIPDFNAFPTTLFIDRTGKVRYKHVGYAPMPVLEAIVQSLLAEDGGRTASR
jgi:thiol-disulfide isomerase/thioredoxin